MHLIEHAGKILARAEIQRLIAERESSHGVRVAYQDLDRIDAYLDDRPLGKGLSLKRSKGLRIDCCPFLGNASATTRQLHWRDSGTSRNGPTSSSRRSDWYCEEWLAQANASFG